jgi:hypothetical protein
LILLRFFIFGSPSRAFLLVHHFRFFFVALSRGIAVRVQSENETSEEDESTRRRICEKKGTRAIKGNNTYICEKKLNRTKKGRR